MRRAIIQITNFGVKQGYEDSVSRSIIFSNVVFVSLPIVYLVFMLIDYQSYLIPVTQLRFDQFVVPVIMGVCLMGLWMNRLGWTTLSRVLFISVWPFLLHVIPIILLNAPTDYYVAYPLGLIFHSVLIQLIFSYKHEKWIYWFFLMANLLGLLLIPATLQRYDADHDLPIVMLEDKYFLFDSILYWLLFNLIVFYVLTVIEIYIQQLHASRDLITHQKEALNALNQNLEALVLQRTARLEEQHEKMREHAFFNTHLLRGPFCRVQGLIELQALEHDPAFRAQIQQMLTESLEELDLRIREIQNLVEGEQENGILP